MNIFLKTIHARTFAILSAVCLASPASAAETPAQSRDAEAVKAEHDAIGNSSSRTASPRNSHPDAQWFPDAALGLFIHWSPASVKPINIGWSMIDGMGGRPAQISPREYWALARDFNPRKTEAGRWLKAAKEAGFTYAVFTTRHHEGFAMWPSAHGEFSTKNYMAGRDLVKEYVDACRLHGLKVGLYYSPPDWYFERNTKNFSRRPDGPPLDQDLKPRDSTPTPEQLSELTREYSRMIRGQLEELLSNYGRIDLLWFDGRAPGVNPDECLSVERIRELQPGIVMNARWHGRGDFINMERTLQTNRVQNGWAEYCNTWTANWSHVDNSPFRAPGFVLGQLALCRSLQINYLPGVGPTRDGEFVDEIYRQFAIVGNWMKANGESIRNAKALPAGEKASVPATASATARFLFALPQFEGNQPYEKNIVAPKDAELTLSGIPRPESVKLLGDNSNLEFNYTQISRTVTIQLPARLRTPLVDVVRVGF